MTKKFTKEKSIEKIIRLAYDSLETHLHYTYIKTTEGKKFHVDAIKQYLDIMNEAFKFYQK